MSNHKSLQLILNSVNHQSFPPQTICKVRYYILNKYSYQQKIILIHMINDFSQIYDSEHDMMHDNIV